MNGRFVLTVVLLIYLLLFPMGGVVAQGQPPAAPSNLEVSPNGSSEVLLTWRDNSDNETGFNIYEASIGFIATVGADSVGIIIGLPPISGYQPCYTVTAYNEFGESPGDSACAPVSTAPAADFQGSPLSGITPLTVNFQNLSTGDYTACIWNYGDGTSGNTCDAYHQHTYSAGSYTVALTVSGPGGSNTKTISNYVNVSDITYSSISGRVTDNSGNPIPDVLISNNNTETTLADINGYYVFSNLVPGFYTLTASKSGYTFSMSYIMVDVPPDHTGANFVGVISQVSTNTPSIAPTQVIVTTATSIQSPTDSFQPTATLTRTISTSTHTITPARTRTLRPSETPEIPFGCVGFGQCPTPSIDLGNSSPPEIVLDSVDVDAAGLDGLQVYYPTSIRLTLHNEGGGLQGPENYEIHFDIFDGSGKKLESRVYASEDEFSLQPLSNIPAAKREIGLSIEQFHFLKAVNNGRMRVSFVPSAGAGEATYWWIQPLTIKPHPEAFETCLAQVLLAVTGHADISAQTKATLIVSSAVLEAGGCTSKETMPGKIQCAVGAIIRIALNVIKDVSEAIKLLGEVFLQLVPPDGEPPACSSGLEWGSAFAQELIRNDFRIDLVGVQSPANILVTNPAGQQVGFLSNGSQVAEITDSLVLKLGEGQLVIFPAEEDATVEFSGTGEGIMSVFLILGESPQVPVKTWYKEVPVTLETLASIELSDNKLSMAVDSNGDGTVDYTKSPDTLEGINRNPPFFLTTTFIGIIGAVLLGSGLAILLLRWVRSRRVG